METVGRLVVYDDDNGWAEGFEFVTSFSPVIMIEESLLLPPERFEDGRLVLSAPLTVSTDLPPES
jgi:hypothetical protein